MRENKSRFDCGKCSLAARWVGFSLWSYAELVRECVCVPRLVGVVEVMWDRSMVGARGIYEELKPVRKNLVRSQGQVLLFISFMFLHLTTGLKAIINDEAFGTRSLEEHGIVSTRSRYICAGTTGAEMRG